MVKALPLFALSGVFLFPGGSDQTTLSVFEPRYRIMIQNHLKSGEPFGVVAPPPNPLPNVARKGDGGDGGDGGGGGGGGGGSKSERGGGDVGGGGAVGTTARVVKVLSMEEDGRCAVVVEGLRRFQVIRK